MNSTIVSRAKGGSPNPTINTSSTFQHRLDAWRSDATKGAICDDAAETATDILNLGGLEDFKVWRDIFHPMLVNHILASEIVIDELARTSAGKLKAFSQILGSVHELYDNHIVWPHDFVQFETVIIEVLRYLLQRCGEAKKQCAERVLGTRICYVDLQHDLERAFVLNISNPACPSEHVRHLPTVFRWLYQDCCDSLWHEELEERERTAEEAVADGDDFYDEPEYEWGVDEPVKDCGCGRSMLWHTSALSDESKWSQTERKLWSKRFPTRRPPKSEKKSPLGLFMESFDYDRPEEDCHAEVMATPGEGHSQRPMGDSALNSSSADEDMDMTDDSYDSSEARQLDYNELILREAASAEGCVAELKDEVIPDGALVEEYDMIGADVIVNDEEDLF
jgi:hypothetical protein